MVNGVVGKVLVMLVKVCGVYCVNLVCCDDGVVDMVVLGIEYIVFIVCLDWMV